MKDMKQTNKCFKLKKNFFKNTEINVKQQNLEYLLTHCIFPRGLNIYMQFTRWINMFLSGYIWNIYLQFLYLSVCAYISLCFLSSRVQLCYRMFIWASKPSMNDNLRLTSPLALFCHLCDLNFQVNPWNLTTALFPSQYFDRPEHFSSIK